MSTDLLAFIKARLDEDEAVARRASEDASWVELNRQPRPTWYVQYWADPDRAVIVADPQSSSYSIVATLEGDDDADAEARIAHIARHDPARVLAEVAAKRQVLELHGIVHREIGWLADGEEEHAEIPVCGLCVPKHSHFQRHGDIPDGGCATVRVLALPYADHPDYQGSWKP